MSPQDVREFLRTTPFLPFRMHTSEGRAYEVRHPDEAMVLLMRVSFSRFTMSVSTTGSWSPGWWKATC